MAYRAVMTLPPVPILTVHAASAILLDPLGATHALPLTAAKVLAQKEAIIVCHAPATAQRLGLTKIPHCFDVLELFAFVHPCRPCVPSPLGLARALDLSLPQSGMEEPQTLKAVVQALLKDITLSSPHKSQGHDTLLTIALVMGTAWPWTPYIFQAFGKVYDPHAPYGQEALSFVWESLPEWAIESPPDPPAHYGITAQETLEKLDIALGSQAENRLGQRDYAATMTHIFDPPEGRGEPHFLLIEGGTGTGKTLGYLAPAALWAARNGASVWISTYTKNLQRQIESTLSALYPTPVERSVCVATRKGRENYLCLLNLEDLVQSPRHRVAAGLMVRWVSIVPDGDLSGAYFAGWLPTLIGWGPTLGLADKRGECIYAACSHYHRCFVERSTRRAVRAQIVVANHALVLSRLAAHQSDEDLRPKHYIFDEGHHLFESSDSVFAAYLSGRELADLRRWILGIDAGGRRPCTRGLNRRVEGLIEDDEAAMKAVAAATKAAHVLPDVNWTQRLISRTPHGPAEIFLGHVYAQVINRTKDHGMYARETPVRPLEAGLEDAIKDLKAALATIRKPLWTLAVALRALLITAQGAEMDAQTRGRVDALARTIEWRITHMLQPWESMLTSAIQGEDPLYVDWLELAPAATRHEVYDVGLLRHWIDPMKPFARVMSPHVHGLAVTSATLRDEGDWGMARLRSGSMWLAPEGTKTAAFFSPFDYGACARIFIITDVARGEVDQVAAAFEALFMASKGGALGLFTAISRLKAVHVRIAASLEACGIQLYAQHVDAMNVGTLLDLFRTEKDTCLLGTDAVRDGVDIPGSALRLLVMDRVPWPRPSILHKARREAFGGRDWDDAITRLRLTQAFGRLIRQEGDKGVMVILEESVPSRLCTGFPPATPVLRVGLAQACREIAAFL